MHELVLSDINNLSPRTERRIVAAIGVSVMVHALLLTLNVKRETEFVEQTTPAITIRTLSQPVSVPQQPAAQTAEETPVSPVELPLPVESTPPITRLAKPIPAPPPNWRQLGKSAAQQAAKQESSFRPMNQLPEIEFEAPRPKSARKPFLESYVSIYGDDMMRYGKHCFIYKQPELFEASTAAPVMMVTRC